MCVCVRVYACESVYVRESSVDAGSFILCLRGCVVVCVCICKCVCACVLMCVNRYTPANRLWMQAASYSACMDVLLCVYV